MTRSSWTKQEYEDELDQTAASMETVYEKISKLEAEYDELDDYAYVLAKEYQELHQNG